MAYENPYTPPTLTGFNASPPSDDGQRTASNSLRWATHLSKIGNPLRSFSEAMSAAVLEAFNLLPARLNGRTDAEIAASVTPINYQYPQLDVRRYYTGSGSYHTAIQNAINVGAQIGAPGYLPSALGEVTITSAISITVSRSGLVGDGQGMSRILCDNCAAFTVAAGLSFIRIENMSVAQAVRYSTTPHTHDCITISGTTASQVSYGTFRGLFIDGFRTALVANAVTLCIFDNVTTAFGFNGLTSTGVSIISTISNCWFSGINAAASFGLALGDGVLDQEGWVIDNTTLFGFNTQISGRVISSWITNCTLDATSETGIVLYSSGTAPSINNVIRNNYIAFQATVAANAGIQLSNSHAASDPQNNGTVVDGNEILQYLGGGGTLNYGIIADGTHDKKCIFVNNRIRGTSQADIRLAATVTEAVLDNNQCYGAGYYFVAGANPAFSENNRGTVITTLEPTVASAAELTLPVGPKVFRISGTTNITSIVVTGQKGKTLVLIFEGALTFTDGSNLLLAGDFVTTANDTITLYCDGTNFFEVCRAIN